MTPRAYWQAWLAFALPVVATLCVPASWPRWLFMWLLAASIYFAGKVLTWSEWRYRRGLAHFAQSAQQNVPVPLSRNVPLWQQSAYLVAWPGMNADRFFTQDETHPPAPPTFREWGTAAIHLVVGGIIFWSAQHWFPPSSPLLLGWAGMIGTVLMLHFGSFQLLSGFWRSAGVDAPPLMNRPTHSTSVTEFWGRRWNMAFRDLTYQFLFRPLRTRLGQLAALVVGFIISGIIHDLVISVPAGGGYGGPTAFFAIQAVAIVAERSPLGRSIGLGRGWHGWLFTALVLLAPVRLLFHDPFVTKIVVPFMKALSAA